MIKIMTKQFCLMKCRLVTNDVSISYYFSSLTGFTVHLIPRLPRWSVILAMHGTVLDINEYMDQSWQKYVSTSDHTEYQCRVYSLVST